MLGLSCSVGFSLIMVSGGLLSSCGAQASDGSGFSCCEALALGHTGVSSCGSQALEQLPGGVAPRLNACGTQAWLLWGLWDLPGSGIELTSPALSGGFFTTEPPDNSTSPG